MFQSIKNLLLIFSFESLCFPPQVPQYTLLHPFFNNLKQIIIFGRVKCKRFVPDSDFYTTKLKTRLTFFTTATILFTRLYRVIHIIQKYSGN